MRRSQICLLLSPLIAACSSAGGAPAGPLVWPPGTYLLEATVSYTGGAGAQRDLHTAELYILPDQSMRMDSHDAVCREPTLPELRRDDERRMRTFHCGDMTFELRPGGGTVTGNLVATVQEGIIVSECLERSSTGACTRTSERVETRPARKEARLRVGERR